MPQRRSPNSRPPRSRIKMTFGSRNLTSNVQGQRKSQVKRPSRCFRRYVKLLKTCNPESHTKVSSDTQHEAKAEWAKEVERMKLIHMPDPDDVIFNFRTLAERVNARLKDEFGARSVRVRGAIKVKCHLMFGVVALAVDQILRVTQLRPAPA